MKAGFRGGRGEGEEEGEGKGGIRDKGGGGGEVRTQYLQDMAVVLKR